MHTQRILSSLFVVTLTFGGLRSEGRSQTPAKQPTVDITQAFQEVRNSAFGKAERVTTAVWTVQIPAGVKVRDFSVSLKLGFNDGSQETLSATVAGSERRITLPFKTDSAWISCDATLRTSFTVMGQPGIFSIVMEKAW
jgi:hypothetical protein